MRVRVGACGREHFVPLPLAPLSPNRPLVLLSPKRPLTAVSPEKLHCGVDAVRGAAGGVQMGLDGVPMGLDEWSMAPDERMVRPGDGEAGQA